MIPDEIRQRTLYPLLARPISRFDFLFGKLIGAIFVTWFAFLLLSALTALALASFHVPFEPIMLQYLLAKMMGLVVVCAVSLALSTFMTPAAAATLSFVLAFGSNMIVRGLVMAYDAASPESQAIFKAVNALIPQYGLFDMSSRVANIGWSPVPAWVLLSLALYMVAYTVTMLTLSWAKFRRQAV
jgi:ABC-type transport system involved in multi-copper enzyme maturation permease subunit